MGDSSEMSDFERYQRILAAFAELAQLGLTLKGLATLDVSKLRDLVVENIAVLLLDVQDADDSSRWLGIHRGFAVRRLQHEADMLGPEAAIEYSKYDQAIRRGEGAFRTLMEVRTDTLAAQIRSQLDRAIRSAKDTFRQLAAIEGPADPALLHTIGRMQAAIDDCFRTLDRFIHNPASGVHHEANSRVTPVDSPPRWRSLSEETREILLRPARADVQGHMSPFDPFD
jgi:hypothetical protein